MLSNTRRVGSTNALTQERICCISHKLNTYSKESYPSDQCSDTRPSLLDPLALYSVLVVLLLDAVLQVGIVAYCEAHQIPVQL